MSFLDRLFPRRRKSPKPADEEDREAEIARQATLHKTILTEADEAISEMKGATAAISRGGARIRGRSEIDRLRAARAIQDYRDAEAARE